MKPDRNSSSGCAKQSVSHILHAKYNHFRPAEAVATVMSSLREWMDKRSERKQAAKANDSGKSRPGEEAHEPQDTTDESQPAALDDFSNIPPPPAPPPRSRAREKRLLPPTSEYRHRESRTLQTRGTPQRPASSGPVKTRTPSPKGSAFSEHFDRQSPKTVTRVNGIDFEMSPAPTGEDGSDMKHDDNQGGGERGRGDFKTRRSSRSQTRRQERVDSHQPLEEDATKDTGDLSLKLNLPEPVQGYGPPEARSSSPSSTKNDLLRRAESPHDGPQISSIGRDPPDDPLDPLHPTNTIGSAVTTSPTRAKGHSPFMSRLRGSRSKATASSSSPITPSFTPPADTEPDLRKFIPPESPTVAVRPPIYDPTKNATQQWESDLGSTSRPARAWDWTKRWTCCRCQCQTIVEQIVCSKLDCVHDRCPENCRVVKWARPRGPSTMNP